MTILTSSVHQLINTNYRVVLIIGMSYRTELFVDLLQLLTLRQTVLSVFTCTTN